MFKRVGLLLLMIGAFCYSKCQDLEPRRYAAIPKDMNGIAFAYALSRGNVVSDPSLPISDFEITAHNFAAGYIRSFGLAGKLSRVVVTLPYTAMSGNLKINGHDTSGTRSGFNDAQIRFGVNLLGSPALSKRDFAKYQQKTILGLSLVINVPIGTYHPDKLINIGTNRWAFRPELGVSRRFKRFFVECYGGVWFYTPNHEFLVNKTEKQDPIFGIQLHGCYYFKNQMWISINGTRFNGGKTYVDDVSAGDLFDNWRVGGTWSFPIAKGQSVKLQFNVGAFATRGYNYKVVSVGYQYIFF